MHDDIITAVSTVMHTYQDFVVSNPMQGKLWESNILLQTKSCPDVSDNRHAIILLY